MTTNTDIETVPDQFLKLQHEMGRILADVVDPLAGLSACLAKAMELPQVDGVWIWFRSSDSVEFRLMDAVGLGDRMSSELDLLPAVTAAGRHLLDRRESIGAWPDVWPELAPAAMAQGWARLAVLPIISQGEVVGALGSGSRHADGLDQHALWVLRTLANATGGLIASVRAETQCRTLSENLGHMLDVFGDRMFIVGLDGTVLYHNRAAGEREASLVGQKFTHVVPDYPRLRREMFASQRETAPGGRAIPLPANLVDETRANQPVDVQVDVGTWDGEPADIVLCRDISDRVSMEQENLRLVTAINQVAEAIVITDASGAILYVNPAFVKLTGYSRREVLGQNPRLLKSGEHDAEFYRDMWQTLRRGEVWSGRVINRRKDGGQFIEDATISPIMDENGTTTHYVGVKRDVTGDVEIEMRLRQTQKMEAIGTLAGGIAHDFNNILYALSGYVELALDDVPEEHPARSPLEEVAKAGQRATHLVTKMLTFGRRGDGERVLVSLADTVSDGMELVRVALPTNIHIETDLCDAGCQVLADPNELHQAVLNLCTNAGYAMQDKAGVLRVTVDQVSLDAAAARARGVLNPGTWARITVADNGSGVDPSLIDRIFEPYFTTRDTHEGRGLGLATVHGIATSHGGYVFLENEPGEGAKFRIYLPAKTAQVPPSAAAAEWNISGLGHVMIVDDEPMVADVLRRGLTACGFFVSTFTDGAVALETYLAEPDAVDAVVTDQVMPGLSGFELASRMLAVRPQLPIILATGYGDQENREQARRVGICHLMPKPLRIRKLGKMLVELTGTVALS